MIYKVGEDGMLHCHRVDSAGNTINEYELGYEPNDREWILTQLRLLPYELRKKIGDRYKKRFRNKWLESKHRGNDSHLHVNYARSPTNQWLRRKIKTCV